MGPLGLQCGSRSEKREVLVRTFSCEGCGRYLVANQASSELKPQKTHAVYQMQGELSVENLTESHR